MSDTIDRQAAIDALTEYGNGRAVFISVGEAVIRIEQLPPIQPKRGKWIYCEDSTADCVDGYRCDQCGFFVPWDYQHKGIDFIQDYNFCPHCGAKMEVNNESN